MAKRSTPKGPKKTPEPQTAYISHASIDRWALVVGVSDYQFGNQGISPLQFSHLDAAQFAAKLKTPACGSFPERNVRLLTNQDASLIEVQRALRSFLSQPKEDDLVIIYFSGHGASDPNRPDQRYFFTYDTDPGDVSGTALPMREIRTCVSETLRAKWVVVIADACHSGALTATKSGTADAEALNQFMQSLKASKKSLAWLTSSQANQVSFESPELANGVFTYYLLRGMEGEADGFIDGNKDGWVTIHELFQYVQRKVSEHTRSAQTPTPGPGDFDPTLPLAYSGEIQAKDYFEVGKLSMYLGEILSDPDRFLAADYYFQRSVEITRGFQFNYEAGLLSARALLAAGDFTHAMDCVSGLIQVMESRTKRGELSEEDLDRLGEGLYLQGILHLLQEAPPEKTKGSLEKLIQFEPEHRRIETLTELLHLQSSKKSRLFIILVGIDDNAHIKLAGAKNDVNIIEQTIVKRWMGIGEVRLTKLTDGDATKARIESAFQEVAKEAQPLDSFFFHFSGLGGSMSTTGEDSTVLFPSDGVIKGKDGVEGGIQAAFFHDLMKSIPCIQKFASLDASASRQLVNLVEKEPLYNLLYGALPGDQSYETSVGGLSYGVFSKAVADALESSAGPSFWQEVRENIKRYQPRQEPMLIGETGFLFEAAPYSFPILLKKVFALAENPTLSDIRLLERFFFRIPYFPELHLRLIYLFEKYIRYDHAQAQLAQLESLQGLPSSILPTAIKIAFRNKTHHQALELLQELNTRYPDEHLKKLEDQYAHLLKAPFHALLIGIDATPSMSAATPSASLDAMGLAEELRQDFDLDPANLTLLVNEQATAANIQEAFKQIVEKTYESPALFYFAGFGTVLPLSPPLQSNTKGILGGIRRDSAPGIPGIISSDGQVIPLSLLEKLTQAGHAENMYAILDIGLKPEAHRFLAFTPKAEPFAAKGIGRESTYAIDPQNGIPAIGAFSLLPGFINSGFGWVPSCLETEKGGVFTQSIIQMLKQLPRDGFKVNQLVTALKQENVPLENKAYLFPRVFGSENKRILKPDPSLESGMKPVEEFFLRRAKEVLSRFESSEPRALIELALVQHLLGDSEGAIRMLESLSGQFPIHLTLGRILTESAGSDKEKWSYAVSELRESPNVNTPSGWYYLGKAMLGMIRAEKETEVEVLFSRYAKAGYPLGHRDEVEEYLNSRDPERQIRALLQKARNLEREQKMPEVLEALEQAAALGSYKALEEQVRIFAILGEWEKAIASGATLIHTGQGSEAFTLEFAKLIPQALGNSKYLQFAKETLAQAPDQQQQSHAKLLSWLEAYQEFLEKNPLSNPSNQSSR